MSSLDSFFSTVNLPSMSEVSSALVRTLNRPNVGVGEVRDLIAKDPALTATLLRVANSAQFGLPRGVGTLDEAIAMVGMNKVRSVALGACMVGAFPELPGLNRHVFWQSSMTCAGYAQWLAGAVDMDGQLAWLTGMMLRLGEILIGQTHPDLLPQIEKDPQTALTRWSSEVHLLGFTEGQITAELARRWNFPMQMVQALQRASDPLEEQAYSRLGAIIHLAALLADTPDASAEVIDALPEAVVDSLKLDIDWLRAKFPDPSRFITVGLQ